MVQSVTKYSKALFLTVLGSLLVRRTATVAVLGLALALGGVGSVTATVEPRQTVLIYVCDLPSPISSKSYVTSRIRGSVATDADAHITSVDIDADSRTNGGHSYDTLPAIPLLAGKVKGMTFVFDITWHRPDGTTTSLSWPLSSPNGYVDGERILDVATGNGACYVAMTYF